MAGLMLKKRKKPRHLIERSAKTPRSPSIAAKESGRANLGEAL
jgi:hypothetical protein